MINRPEKLVINGLPLPAALIEAIRSGLWVAPSIEKLEGAFPLAADPRQPIGHPAFFSLENMEFENKGWRDETLEYYLGKKDASVQPGDIDPAQSVIIADLGPDRLIALDYRVSKEKPRVVYLASCGESRWAEAAPDVERLLVLLGMVK